MSVHVLISFVIGLFLISFGLVMLVPQGMWLYLISLVLGVVLSVTSLLVTYDIF
jgi:hypothetical protein